MEREFIQHCENNNLEGVNDCLSRWLQPATVETGPGMDHTPHVMAGGTVGRALVIYIICNVLNQPADWTLHHRHHQNSSHQSEDQPHKIFRNINIFH